MRFFILILLTVTVCTSCNADQKTAWEEYLKNPSSKNAKNVTSIEYQGSKTSNLALDLNVLMKKVDSSNSDSVDLSVRLLSNISTSGLSGTSISIVQNNLSKIIKKDPKLYLLALEKSNSQKCVALTNVGFEYVDRLGARINELKSRLKALQKIKNIPLNKICVKELESTIASYKESIQAEDKGSNSSGTSTQKKKYQVNKFFKNGNWIVSIKNLQNKVLKEAMRNPVEPEISWLNTHTVVIQINCGSSCTAYYF